MSSNNRLMKIYTDTILDTKELLNPEQMDNDITNHIKENLKNHYEKKCYKQYGYINKIYKVDKIEETIINSEDILSSQQFKVKFSCQLFFIINEREIICKMDRITPKINTAIKIKIFLKLLSTENSVINPKDNKGKCHKYNAYEIKPTATKYFCDKIL